MIAVASDTRIPAAARSGPRHAIRRISEDKVALAGLVVLVVLVAAAVLVPILVPLDPTETNLPARLLPPGTAGPDGQVHALGTDSLGRDVLLRVLHGSRISLFIGFASAAVAMIIGVPLGLLAGYRGGLSDAVIMRLADIQLGFPAILLYISALALVRPDVWTIVLVLGVSGWVIHARLIRAQTQVQVRMEYVEAARSVGVHPLRIVARHILPNVLAPTVVVASFSVATFIIAASSLSFLGLGLSPATPDWGIMIADSVKYIRVAWWPSTFAGVALSLTVFGVNVVGDWLRDYLDPRLRMQ